MGHFLCRYVTNYHTYNGLMTIPTIGVHSNYTWHTCLSQRSRCSYPVPASSLGTEDSKNMWWPVWRVRWNLPKFVILSSFIILRLKIRREQIFPSCGWFTVIPMLLHWSYIPIVVPCCTPIVNGSLLVPSSKFSIALETGYLPIKTGDFPLTLKSPQGKSPTIIWWLKHHFDV